jgi:hypothetical protein
VAAPGEQRRRLRRAHRPSAVQWEDPATATLTAERSTLINKEVVLFLFQLEMDSQLQRALTYERFDMAQEVRTRREQVDAALGELQQLKGPSCGARVAGGSGQMEFAPQIMTLKAQMAEAAEAEQYAEAAALRDRLRALEAAAAKAAEAAAQFLCPGRPPAGCLLGACWARLVCASSPAIMIDCLLPRCPPPLHTTIASFLPCPARVLPACPQLMSLASAWGRWWCTPPRATGEWSAAGTWPAARAPTGRRRRASGAPPRGGSTRQRPPVAPRTAQSTLPPAPAPPSCILPAFLLP